MKKLCEYCGQPFEASSVRNKFCNRIHYVTCPICRQSRKIKDRDQLSSIHKYGPTCCSYECRVKQTQKTSLERYGCIAPGNNPEARQKASMTMIKHLGVPYAMMDSEIRAKAKETLVEKYGVDNANKSPEISRKRIQTTHERYGDVMPFNRPECYEKQHQTIMERYGVQYATELPQVYNRSRISKINQNFGHELDALGITYQFEKGIQRKSYDIHIVDQNILIEIDPTYTHSSYTHYNMKGLYQYYHRDKTQLAEDNGYRCIHVFDWDDWSKIIDLIRPIERRIFARKCTVYRLNKDIGDEFLSKYHIQGTCRGQLLYLGLVYEGELVQAMTFGKSRFNKNYYVELLRLCTKPGVVVVGGASKLFSYATSEYGLYNIISYCDRSKFSGDVYEKMGMKFSHVTPPQEIWSRDTQHITANLLRARGYDQLFHTSYGKGTSNEELMIQDGWLPVYDCGQRVYVFD